jgi:acetyl esterase/lipase
MQKREGMRYLLRHPSLFISFPRLNRRLEEDNDRLLRSGSIDLNSAQLFFPDRNTRIAHARVVRAVLERLIHKSLEGYLRSQDAEIEELHTEEVKGEWIRPVDDLGKGVILHIHGGGFNLLSPASHRGLNLRLASGSRTRIFSVEYRLAPEHVHPAALEDCLHAFSCLLDQGYATEQIILMGDSAGGCLALAMLHRLKQLGRVLPAAAILLSPLADLTFQGPSLFANAPADPIVCDQPMAYFSKCYIERSDAELTDPLVSPMYGDFHGFPPLLVIASTSEMLYDDAIRISEKAACAGVEVQLEEWDDMIHVFPLFGLAAAWPEVDEAYIKMNRFIERVWGNGR